MSLCAMWCRDFFPCAVLLPRGKDHPWGREQSRPVGGPSRRFPKFSDFFGKRKTNQPGTGTIWKPPEAGRLMGRRLTFIGLHSMTRPVRVLNSLSDNCKQPVCPGGKPPDSMFPWVASNPRGVELKNSLKPVPAPEGANRYGRQRSRRRWFFMNQNKFRIQGGNCHEENH